MARSARHVIAALLGGATIAFAAAGWALWLSWGATGWPRLDGFARGFDEGAELFASLLLMLLGQLPMQLARSLLPSSGQAVAQTEAAQPRRSRRRPLADFRVQLALAAILLAAVLPYAFGAAEWSWFSALIHHTPGWVPMTLVSLIVVLGGARCIRDALRASSAPAVGT
ncbi:hypothetical protein [uncultured Albimonas sp.]|mgnify:CR=1 FL=1|uniref:hypothetical protein n=1 Tax=uncultured Albimonas sp. TaxID=1331701 RepID=UPI0030EE1B6E|tara:strand:+ start:266 stop:772 length:507 start_codon:yes stop_codon:yes gene_type:complete